MRPRNAPAAAAGDTRSCQRRRPTTATSTGWDVMPRVIEDVMVEPAARTLLGAIDADGGATDEQLAVLAAMVTEYWGRPDLDLDSLEPLDPTGAATAVTIDADRARSARAARAARAVPASGDRRRK